MVLPRQSISAREKGKYSSVAIVSVVSEKYSPCGQRSATQIVKGTGVAQHSFPDNHSNHVPPTPTGWNHNLHFHPLVPALTRLRTLLAPGGTLVIIGLARPTTIADYVYSAVSFPLSIAMRQLKPAEKISAPIKDPTNSLTEIRAAADAILPAAQIRRHLFFRYSLIWTKP